jgi:hypothetical protein
MLMIVVITERDTNAIPPLFPIDKYLFSADPGHSFYLINSGH